MTPAPILVTGATGNLGGAAARSLIAAGLPVRVAGTDANRLAGLFPGIETAMLDFRRSETFDAAVTGARAIFLIRPPAVARVGPTLNKLIDVAGRNGVGHVTFVSVTGADTNRIVPHHRVEEHFRTANIPWTVLRPGFFAQNLADAYRSDIRHDDRIYLPAGEGRVAFVDTRDIGDVAATVFADPARHRAAAYTLTGAEAIDFSQVAALLTEVLGRPITYQTASTVGYLRHLRSQHLPLAQSLVQTLLHAGLRRGQAEQVDPTLPRLLGRSPRTMAQYVHEHRELWLPK